MRVAFALAVALIGALMARHADAADVVVRVQGVANDRGEVVVGICTADMFIGGTCAHRGTAPARPGTVLVVVAGVAPGTYAVRAYHDENGNRRIDRNFLGIPTEGYGFGNDARVTFAPPSFADAAITVGGGGAETALTLRY
ncbi:DUF2141 domain-containing protein [Azospirillum sp. sgz301742]